MQKQRALLALILVCVAAAIVVLIQLPLNLGLDLRGGAQLTIQIKPTEDVQEISEEDLKAVERVMERRVNSTGVSEAVVQTLGNDKIIVQLPGVSDPEVAERRLQGTAQLEFREQIPGTDTERVRELLITQQALRQQLDEQIEEGADEEEIAAIQEELSQVKEAISALYEPADLTGKQLTNARRRTNQSGNQWEVGIEFNQEGAQKFAELTKNLAGTGRTIGIFLDGELVSAPTVPVQFAESGITGGSAVIEGNFTAEEAYDLEIQLRGGSLPFPVEVVENRTVGATLGRESIQRSIYAGLAGLVLVLIFMGVYYRLPGLIADVSLIIYTLLTLGCYALVGVTLTLPGIAGFILSIGMAVDANVLIFERTREELRTGRSLYRSVESGFYRAFSSILDSNVTTLIACAALFGLGSGLVKGFALTLAIGVVVSMFTALTCSRTLMMLVVLSLPKVRQKPELFCPDVVATAKS